MKKFFLICSFFWFFLGISQEKKIVFDKEIDYKVLDKNRPDGFLKTYAGKNGEFLTRMKVRDIPMYFFTDGLGTSSVSLDLNSHLYGSSSSARSLFYGSDGYYDDDSEEQKYILESKKLDTKETILGMPCSHYLLNFKSRNDEKTDKEGFKICIDDRSDYNSIPVLSGLVKFFDRNFKFKNSGLKGLILKGGPERTYDKEYFVATSIKDSKDFVYFDHRKSMMQQQRKQDSLMLAYKKQQEEYAKTYALDSAAVTADSAVAVVDSAAAAAYPYPEETDYYIPDYVSEYKDLPSADGNLAINNLPDESLWKGLPSHCKNFEKNLPEFNNKELKKHLKNYVGQTCDMYLTQSNNHNVGIKITLDEIRREVLYLNDIRDKLDESDKKKLNTYLKNLD